MTVGWGASSGITFVAGTTPFAVIAFGVMLAIDADSSGGIASISMAIAFALDTVTTGRMTVEAGFAWLKIIITIK